ncbi:hypothetical protein ACOME3_001260 [Neoechinorhynchus agilis]
MQHFFRASRNALAFVGILARFALVNLFKQKSIYFFKKPFFTSPNLLSDIKT